MLNFRTCADHFHQLDLCGSASSGLLLLLRLAGASRGLGNPKAHAIAAQQARVATRLCQISTIEGQSEQNNELIQRCERLCDDESKMSHQHT
jgi:hypothetical protein